MQFSFPFRIHSLSNGPSLYLATLQMMKWLEDAAQGVMWSVTLIGQLVWNPWILTNVHMGF